MSIRRFIVGFILALTFAPTPSHAGAFPTWSKAITKGRFKLVLGGVAVLDKETGLVWETVPATFPAWAAASDHCYKLLLGGRLGWRLPAIEELATVMPFAGGAPFTVINDYFWSATTQAGDTTKAWAFDHTTGSGGPITLSKGNIESVWCVRGGHGYDGQ